ncbi:ankyrin repeat-containing domain protein, partial [Zopfochytrium polystomum]
PLHYAAVEGHEEMALYLIEKGANVIAVNTWGFTPMMYAAARSPRTVAPMLEKGEDVRKASSNGTTALHLAAQAGNLDVVRQLLRAGAAVDAVTNARTPLILAADKGHLAVIDGLLSTAPTSTSKTRLSTSTAPRCKRRQCAGTSTSCGVDVGAKFGEHEATALHFGAFHGHVAVVAALVEKGKAAMDGSDLLRETALHYAAADNRLMSHGADKDALNAKNKDQTPFHYAVGNKFMEAIAVLMKHGATGNGLSGRQECASVRGSCDFREKLESIFGFLCK